MKTPFKHFDLPKHHLTSDRHYVPLRARQSDEIERRRSLPRGSVLAEQQLQGIQIAGRILEQVVEKPDVEYASKVIAASGLNSSWYGFARDSTVMRRRLYLPYLAANPDSLPPTSDEYLKQTKESLAESAIAAEGLLAAISLRLPRIAERKRIVGLSLGNASLALANVMPARSYSPQSDPYEIQSVVREQSLQSLTDARTLSMQIGTPPSLAQLADRDSDLSVYIRRTAPNGIYQAFEAATAA